MPRYTLRNKATGDELLLRGLAGRAPYFHNGSAATIAEAVDFYDTRFALRLTDHEKSDLIAFLLAL